MSEKYGWMKKKGDRVWILLVNDNGDEKKVYGTVTDDTPDPFLDWTSVEWDGDKVASLFPVSAARLHLVNPQPALSDDTE